ncbi:MAG: hypothetical protein KBS70_02300 [Bacteroidales bacterium]|nr:hypothetical protein [Candidatus Colicola equi]
MEEQNATFNSSRKTFDEGMVLITDLQKLLNLDFYNEQLLDNYRNSHLHLQLKDFFQSWKDALSQQEVMKNTTNEKWIDDLNTWIQNAEKFINSK